MDFDPRWGSGVSGSTGTLVPEGERARREACMPARQMQRPALSRAQRLRMTDRILAMILAALAGNLLSHIRVAYLLSEARDCLRSIHRSLRHTKPGWYVKRTCNG